MMLPIRGLFLHLGIICCLGASAQRVLPIGSGIPNTAFGVFDLEEFNGQLIIGGWFPSFDGHVRRNIQGWDGVQHFDLPGAFESTISHVRALQLFDGVLVAAGQDALMGNVGSWDGTAWTAMGSGLPQRVTTLVEFNGELYAAGWDSTVSRWTGADWVPLGEKFNDIINVLAVHDGALYVGGRFTGPLSGGVPLARIAVWSGSDWMPVDEGFDDDVLAMQSDPSGLLIGGDFTHTSDLTLALPYWTRWTSGSFEQVPEVIAYSVSGFHRLTDGRLLVGGGELGVIQNGALMASIPFKEMRVMREFQGMLLVAGQGPAFGAYSEVGAMGRFAEGTTFASLDINNVNATLSSFPSGFYQWWSNGPGFEVPQGEGTHAIYCTSPWLFAYENGVRHSSLPFYSGSSDLWGAPWSGPIADSMSSDFLDRYHRVWKLDRAMIQLHIASWNVAGYTVPEAISSWPGNGDVPNGESARIAPFADLNGNDFYEPDQGEYPLIKGDQAVYSIQHTVNDSVNGLSPWSLPSLGFDLHVMAYAFEDAGPALAHTVFVNYRYVNRESVSYDSIRFGQFADIDVGCWGDDFAGCDSTRNMFFAYNWDDLDESCDGAVGYGQQPPAEGVMFLNAPMLSHRTYPRETPSPPTLDDLMYGTHQGVPFMALGYPTHYEFPGGAFVETTPTPTTPDRRSIGATGPFTLGPGDTLCMDIAFIYARAPFGGAYASVEALKLRSDSVQSYYDAQGLACNSYPVMTGVRTDPAIERSIRIFPNPASDAITITSGEPLGDVDLMDATGRSLFGTSTSMSRITISMGHLPNGFYVIRSVGKHDAVSHRVAIQR